MKESLGQGSIGTSSAAVTTGTGLSTSAMAALGYFCGIAAIIALVIEPYNKDKMSRYHAFQALLFQGTWLVGNIAFAFVSVIIGSVVSLTLGTIGLGFVGAIVTSMLSLVGLLLGLGMFVTWVYLIVAAANGKEPKLPKLHNLARSFGEKA